MLRNDLLAKFILRSRDWTTTSHEGDFFTQVADTLKLLLTLQSGFILYEEPVPGDTQVRMRVYATWGVFRDQEWALESLLENNRAEVGDSFPTLNKGWVNMGQLPLWSRDYLRNSEVSQVGVWPLTSRGWVTGAVVLGDTNLNLRADSDLIATCVVQIGLIFDMLRALRTADDSEKRLRSLFEHHPEAIFEVALDGTMVAANARVASLSGYNLPELRGMEQRMNLVIDEHKERVARHRALALQGTPQYYTVTIRHKDGHLIHTSMTNVPIIVDGKVSGTYRMVKDITSQIATDELLRQSEKLAIVGQLAAGVAHEIRNPLTSIKGFVKLMSRTDEPLKYMGIMEHELEQIEAVTNEMLLLGKPQATQCRLTDVASLLRGVTHFLSGEAILRSVEVCIEQDGEVPLVECEPNHLEQVFVNVIKNAIEATGQSDAVVIRITSNDVIVAVEVIDRGAGIPSTEIDRIGEPFFTTKRDGTGLGLMVSQRIVLNHHGNLDISSRVDEGTTVRIELPLRQSSCPWPDERL